MKGYICEPFDDASRVKKEVDVLGSSVIALHVYMDRRNLD